MIGGYACSNGFMTSEDFFALYQLCVATTKLNEKILENDLEFPYDIKESINALRHYRLVKRHKYRGGIYLRLQTSLDVLSIELAMLEVYVAEEIIEFTKARTKNEQ